MGFAKLEKNDDKIIHEIMTYIKQSMLAGIPEHWSWLSPEARKREFSPFLERNWIADEFERFWQNTYAEIYDQKPGFVSKIYREVIEKIEGILDETRTRKFWFESRSTLVSTLEELFKHPPKRKLARTLSEKDLRKIVRKWEEKLEIRPNQIQIKKMKSKWSSCSKKGKITLNSELTRLPKKIAEYVILHELAHLIAKNHGKEFIALLFAHMPNWERLYRTLRIHIEAGDIGFSYRISEAVPFTYFKRVHGRSPPMHVDVHDLRNGEKQICLSRLTYFVICDRKTHRKIRRTEPRMCTPRCEDFSSEEVKCINKKKGTKDIELVKQAYLCVHPRRLSATQVAVLTDLDVQITRHCIEKMLRDGELLETGTVLGERQYSYSSKRKP